MTRFRAIESAGVATPWMTTRAGRTFTTLFVAHILLDCYGGIWPIFKKLAGLDLVGAGLIATATTVLTTGMQPLFGLWADRHIRRRRRWTRALGGRRSSRRRSGCLQLCRGFRSLRAAGRQGDAQRGHLTWRLRHLRRRGPRPRGHRLFIVGLLGIALSGEVLVRGLRESVDHSREGVDAGGIFQLPHLVEQLILRRRLVEVLGRTSQ